MGRKRKSDTQFKFSDYLQKQARNSAEFWYGEIWKTVGKCVLCDLRERYVVKRVDDIILTTNIYPYIDGHLMMLPKRHVTYLKDLTDTEWKTMRAAWYMARKMLKQLLGVQSTWLLYREGQLGDKSEKTVEHLHVHILPYVDGLVNWKYQPIKNSAFEVAAAFKKNDNMMDQLLQRYKLKYERK